MPIAVSTWPLMEAVQARLWRKRGLAVTAMTLVLLLVFLVPFALALPYANLMWTGILVFIIGLILASAFSAILVFARLAEGWVRAMLHWRVARAGATDGATAGE